MVIAIAVGIGQNVFNTFISSFASGTPTVNNAMTLVLASLTFLLICQSLPSIAAGLVSGGPQLSAGSALGAAGTMIGTGLAVGAAAKAGAGAVGSATKMTGSVAKGAASMAGAATTAGSLAVGASDATSRLGKAAAFTRGVGTAAVGAAKSAVLAPGRAAGAALSKAFKEGGAAGFKATGGTIKGSEPVSSKEDTKTADKPTWAKMIINQNAMHAASAVAHALNNGGKGMSMSGPNLKVKDEE